MKLYKNHSMKEYSNMKIGGIAKEFIEVEDKNELLDVLKEKENIFIIGNGTNTLIFDGELETTFVSLKAIDYIDANKADYIYSTGFAVLTPKNEILPKFLTSFVWSLAFTNQVKDFSKGMLVAMSNGMTFQYYDWNLIQKEIDKQKD